MDNSTQSAEKFKIGILLVDGFALMSYAAIIEPLRAANLLAKCITYEIYHIPATGTVSTSSSGAVIRADSNLGAAMDYNLVLVLAGGDPLAFNNQSVFQWLRHLAKRGVRLGGVSGGPVILALAELMNGRRMTVHWEHARALGELLPALVIERSLYVMDRDRITCAGGIAPMDMMHALISEHHGARFARRISDWFMHTQIRPPAGAQRAGLVERYATTSQPVILAIEAMVNHLADTLALVQLAAQAEVSPRQLNRLFRGKIGNSTMGFYRDMRLEKARDLLTQTPLSTTEIALATGFASSAHFSQAFRRKFGNKPTSLRLFKRD